MQSFAQLFGQVRSVLRRFTACQTGATAIEYVIVASLIAVVVIASIEALGSANLAMWTLMAGTITSFLSS